MKNWKNKFERTVGMNAAIVNAEQSNFLKQKVIEDLEFKNKILHRCAYTAHNTLTEWLGTSEEDWDNQDWYTKFEELKTKLEDLLSENSQKALESKPSITV